MVEYNIGNWIINRQTKEVFEIVWIYDNTYAFKVRDVNKFNNVMLLAHADIVFNYNKLDKKCPVAQTLYIKYITRSDV